MSKWCRFVLSVACAAAGLAGCDDGSPRQSQCDRICEKRELCDSSTDEMDCVDSCLEQDYLSDTFVSEWARCVAPGSVSCDEAMDEEKVDDCVTDALRAEEPSDLVEDVCTALASKLAACKDDVDPLAARSECVRGDALKLSDDYLQQSRSCVDSLCEELDGCLEDLADDSNTELTIAPIEHDREHTGSESQDDQGVPYVDGGQPLPDGAYTGDGGSDTEEHDAGAADATADAPVETD